MTIVLHDDNLS